MSGGLTRPLSDAEKAQLRAPIAEWLQRAEIEDSDSSLVEYAVILAATPRSQSELNNELSCFLENRTEAFIDWLFPLLAKIQTPPVPEVSLPKPAPATAPAQVVVAPVQAPVVISSPTTASAQSVSTAAPAQPPANAAKQPENSDDSAARAAARRERFGAVTVTSASTTAPVFSDSDISAWSTAANALPTRAQRQRALTLIDTIRSAGNADARSELVRFLAANAPAPAQPKPAPKPSEAPKSEPVPAVPKQSAPAKQADNKPPRVISTADLKSKTAEVPSKPAKAASQTQPVKSAKPVENVSKSAPPKAEVKITVTAPAADSAPTARRIKVSRVGDGEASKPARSQRSRSPVRRRSRSRSPSRERRYRRSRSRSRSPSRSRSRGSRSHSRSRSYSRSPRSAPTSMPSGPSVSQRPVVPMQMVPMQGGFQPVQPFLMHGRPMQPMMMNPAMVMNSSNMHMNQAGMNPAMNPAMAPQMNRQPMIPQYVPVPLHRVQMMMGQSMGQNNMMMPGFQSQMSRMPMPAPVVQQSAPMTRPQAQPVQSMSSPHVPAPMVTQPVNTASSGPSHPANPPSANRCSYWPMCSRGQSCHFQHPTAPCAAFPKCEYSESTCPYIHQPLPCRFGPQCTRSNCNFVHDMQRLAALQSVWMSMSHGSTVQPSQQSQPPRQRLHINMNASNLK